MRTSSVELVAVVLIAEVAACGGGSGPAGDPDAAPPIVDAATLVDAAMVIGTPAPEGGWPVSSRCVEDAPGGCVVVEAETWDRSGLARLVSDADTGAAQLLGPDGEVIVTIEPVSWFAASGLTALPGGSWVLAGAALGPGDLHVGADTVVLPTTYNRLVIHVDAGGVAWAQVIEGASAERALIAARTDGSVVVAGEQMIDTTIGSSTLAGPVWVYDFFLAALRADGAWAWAIELPSPPSPLGDFELQGLSLGDQSEAIANGSLRGTLSVAGDTLVGPVSANAVASEAGVWIDLTATGP